MSSGHEDRLQLQDGPRDGAVFPQARAPYNFQHQRGEEENITDGDRESQRHHMVDLNEEEDDRFVRIRNRIRREGVPMAVHLENMMRRNEEEDLIEQALVRMAHLTHGEMQQMDYLQDQRIRRWLETPTFYQERVHFGYSSGIEYDRSVDEIELITASPDFDPQQLFLRRVTACVGWAVYGLVFEFAEGKRMGYILVRRGRSYEPLTDDRIDQLHGVGWTDVEYGDYIVAIHGSHLDKPDSRWFCHTVVLEFASGRSIRYEPDNSNWRGEPFSYTVPQPCLVYRITFGHAQKECMRGLMTSLHLPISKLNLQYLPSKYQKVVQDAFRALQLVDLDLVESGGTCPTLGEDLWWTVLGMLGAWQLPLTQDQSQSIESQSDLELDEETGGRDEEIIHQFRRSLWGPRREADRFHSE